jgi:two-component system, NarL family, response regulator DevR
MLFSDMLQSSTNCIIAEVFERVTMSKTIRILIADDHSVVRAGLKALLERQGPFQVVAEAATGEEAVVKARESHPDVAVLDIRMPGLSGIEACRQIVQTVEGCHVIMLTSYAEDELLFSAIQAGASGYVLKRIGDNELVHAIERVSRGEGMLDPAMTATVLAEMRKAGESQNLAAFADLTSQELAVLALIAQGLTNRQIAIKLYLGEGTVRNYVSSVLAKIGVSNRAEAAAYAVKHNIEELILPSSHDEQ